MGKENIKKGVLHLKDESEWKTHLFVLFEDKLCYTVEPCSDDPNEKQNDDTVSMMGEEDRDVSFPSFCSFNIVLFPLCILFPELYFDI